MQTGHPHLLCRGYRGEQLVLANPRFNMDTRISKWCKCGDSYGVWNSEAFKSDHTLTVADASFFHLTMDLTMTPPPLSYSPEVSTPSSDITNDSVFLSTPQISHSSVSIITSDNPLWPEISGMILPKRFNMQLVAKDVAEVITKHCANQGGLANRSLVLQAAFIAVTYLTDDRCLQQEYHKDVVNELDNFIMQQQLGSWIHIHSPTPKIIQNDEMTPQVVSKPRAKRSARAAGKHVCHHCWATFSRTESLRRHHRDSCTYTKANKTSQHYVFSVRN